jgi:hypothetical protein
MQVKYLFMVSHFQYWLCRRQEGYCPKTWSSQQNATQISKIEKKKPRLVRALYGAGEETILLQGEST